MQAQNLFSWLSIRFHVFWLRALKGLTNFRETASMEVEIDRKLQSKFSLDLGCIDGHHSVPPKRSARVLIACGGSVAAR